MSTDVICIPDTELRGLLQRPFHSHGYRVVAAAAELRADEQLLATLTPSQNVYALNTVHVDTGEHQADLLALREWNTATQFVNQIATFAACPDEFLDEAA